MRPPTPLQLPPSSALPLPRRAPWPFGGSSPPIISRDDANVSGAVARALLEGRALRGSVARLLDDPWKRPLDRSLPEQWPDRLEPPECERAHPGTEMAEKRRSGARRWSEPRRPPQPPPPPRWSCASVPPPESAPRRVVGDP